MYSDVVLNEYGFYTLKKFPTDEEREHYYKNKYYQESRSSYEINYTEQELRFFKEKLEQKLLLIRQHLPLSPEKCLFLDIGCGEGFALDFFQKSGFSVVGLDYSIAGIVRHNPEMEDNVVIGDIYNSIDQLTNNTKQFDIVNMDYVLEHVTDPKALIQQAHGLLKSDGIMIIKVPNDFSRLQEYLWAEGIIKKPHWVGSPDHISYFNRNGLINLCKSAGFHCIDFLSDQLIEFSALNPNTNYFENKNVGKSCHFARIAQEHILHNISPQKTLELYRVLGDMGLGRVIIGVFRKVKGQ